MSLVRQGISRGSRGVGDYIFGESVSGYTTTVYLQGRGVGVFLNVTVYRMNFMLRSPKMWVSVWTPVWWGWRWIFGPGKILENILSYSIQYLRQSRDQTSR